MCQRQHGMRFVKILLRIDPLELLAYRIALDMSGGYQVLVDEKSEQLLFVRFIQAMLKAVVFIILLQVFLEAVENEFFVSR